MGFFVGNSRFLFVWFIVVFVSSLFVFFIFSSSVIPSLQPSSLGECKSLYSNPDGVVDIVMFADEPLARKYADLFLSSPPFDEYPDVFNIFFIDDYVPDCDLYAGKALLCATDKMMIREAARCPNDYIITFESHPLSVRSSSYLNIISINENHPAQEVFLHEWGHAFASFAEEYVSSGSKVPKGALNCQDSCNEFSNPDSCYSGCTYNSLQRSVFEGVMRSLSTSDYGAHNEDLLRDRIAQEVNQGSSLVTGFAIEEQETCEDQKALLVTLSADQTKILSQEYITGCGGSLGYGQSTLTLTSDGIIVLSDELNTDYFFTEAPNPDTLHLYGEVVSPDFPTIFKIPFVPEANPDEIRIVNAQGDEIIEKIEAEGSYACNVNTL